MSYTRCCAVLWPDAWEPLFDSLVLGSASRQAPLYTKQDSAMPILEMLFPLRPVEAREKLAGEASMLEGLQLTHGVATPIFQMRPGASVFLGKRLFLDPTDRQAPRTYRSSLAASFWDSLSQLDESTALYRRSICSEDEIIQTRSSEISLSKSDLPFAIACTWTLKPLDYSSLKSGRVLMNVTSLSLADNESLVLEYDNGSHWILLYDFKGPLENELGDPVIYETINISELIVKPGNETNSTNSSDFINSTRTIKVIKNDTHFDLPLDLRIRFLAPGLQLHHVKLRSMVGVLYQCAWVVFYITSLTAAPASRGRQHECG